MTRPLNPLTMPLDGLHVIEASAGTGKTWTLAALYVRLVLGHGRQGPDGTGALYPPQILVMTFTEAATFELRSRIRARLAEAARYFNNEDQNEDDSENDSENDNEDGVDDFLRQLRAAYPHSQWAECARRLDMSAQWMDDAAIFTIHGWSSRMLKTHAFDSASLFQQSRVEDSDQLRLQAVQDYWRKWLYAVPSSQLGALKPLGAEPAELLTRLKPLWALTDKAPGVVLPPAGDPFTLFKEWETWSLQLAALETAAREACTPALIELLIEVIAAKRLKGYRKDSPPKLAELLHGESLSLLADTPKAAAIRNLERFSTSDLLALGWEKAVDYPVFGHIEALQRHLKGEPEIADDLLNHAAAQVAQAYRQAKEHMAQFDFSDLLQCLYVALQAEDGRLAAAIRQQYPVALVDEFQDTDPWQYGALSRIYGESVDPDTGLIMIGDPKQAIYSFRGADLKTYLTARGHARDVHSLSGNFRSTPELVEAVNHVFMQAQQPFGDIPFEQVEARKSGAASLTVGGQVQKAMTVWHIAGDPSPNQDVFIAQMSELFASGMVELLNGGAAQPGDMAVLVRSGKQAQGIRRALSRRGVRSVYLSERDSVFATSEALDLWRLLRAVANPRSTETVRAALATRLWNLPFDQLEAMLQDEAAWDGLVDRFHEWRAVWQTQGVLPMLYRVLHDQSIPARMLDLSTPEADGERRLTNVLHLGDLLQKASTSLQGETALIRYLEQQIQNPQSAGDAAQLRLESDANLVQVITVHKAKGLQYPLVFLPFVSHFKSEGKDFPVEDAERLAEDIRLTYVALTRAEKAMWLGLTEYKGDVDENSGKCLSALAMLLQRQMPGDLGDKLRAWSGCPHIDVVPAPAPASDYYLPPAVQKRWKSVPEPARNLVRRWWTASFSALTRELMVHPETAIALETSRDARLEDAQIDSARGADLPADLLPLNSFPAGSSYGTLLHDLLEWQFERGWPITLEPPSPAQAHEWEGLLQRKAVRLDLNAGQVEQLNHWIQQVVQMRLQLPDASSVIWCKYRKWCQWQSGSG